MRYRILAVLGLLVATAVMGSVVGSRTDRHEKVAPRPQSQPQAQPQPQPEASIATEESPVEELDRCIQSRFHDVAGFGMARMPVAVHVPRFDPETPREKEAVTRLQQDGLEVVLYLGGRRLLASGMAKEQWEKSAGTSSAHRGISDPIVVSGTHEAQDLPRPWELWEQGRKALESASTADVYTSAVGRWKFEARTVRASRKACLECHRRDHAGDGYGGQAGRNELKVGNPLGVIIYLYAKQS